MQVLLLMQLLVGQALLEDGFAFVRINCGGGAGGGSGVIANISSDWCEETALQRLFKDNFVK